MRRALRTPAGLVAASLAVITLSSCVVSVTTSNLHDDRIDRTARANGPAAIIGDSVGYGLVVFGGLWNRLGADGWGPVRSFSVLGIHAAPEYATDLNTVTHWIEQFRAEGTDPKMVVVVAGANDVGYYQGADVIRNIARIDAALAAIGDVPVVWTTISHNNRAYMDAWNAALRYLAGTYENLLVCDWATEVAAHPGYLARDKVHMTMGPDGGYAKMRDFVAGCVQQAAA